MISFGVTDGRRPISKTVRITPAPKSDLVILDAWSSDPIVTTRLQTVRAADGGREFEVVVTQLATEKAGTHFGNVRIGSSSRYLPEVTVPVMGRIILGPGSGRD